MMRISSTCGSLGLLYLCACGAERAAEAPASQREGPGADAATSVPLTPTEYTTTFHFLPTESATTSAVVLQFANTAGADGLSHRYLGWLLNRSGWRTVLDANFSNGHTRAPWRLFPAESLQLTVSADGEPDAIMLRSGSTSYTLDLGAHLDAWEDRAGTRHDIRSARWMQGGRSIAGLAIQHRFAIPDPERPARFGPYEWALLRSEDNTIIVLFHSRLPDTYGDSFAWMYADGLTRRWTALESRTVEVVNSPQLRRNIPIRTWFHIPEPDIKGELSTTAQQLDELPTQDGPKPYNALYRVRGWIEFAGERRNVEGLLEIGES